MIVFGARVDLRRLVAPGGMAEPEGAARRLYDWDNREEQQGWWWLASQQVVHLSRTRIQEDPSNPTYADVSLAGLSAIRDDVRAVWERWEPFMLAVVAERWRSLDPQ